MQFHLILGKSFHVKIALDGLRYNELRVDVANLHILVVVDLHNLVDRHILVVVDHRILVDRHILVAVNALVGHHILVANA